MHNIPLWSSSDLAPPDGTGDVGSSAGHTLDIDVDRRAGRPIVAHVIGSVDLLTAPELRMCIDACIGTADGFVLDLRRVDFLAAAGLTVLAETDSRARRDDLAWALVAGNRPVLRPLEVLGLVDVLPTYDTVPDAVAAVRAAAVSG